jgi:hypothetical protein
VFIGVFFHFRLASFFSFTVVAKVAHNYDKDYHCTYLKSSYVHLF